MAAGPVKWCTHCILTEELAPDPVGVRGMKTMQEVRLLGGSIRLGSLCPEQVRDAGWGWVSPGFPSCTRRRGVGEDAVRRLPFNEGGRVGKGEI